MSNISIRNINKSDCCGCTACASICPKNAILFITDEEGFVYPDVNEIKCIGCGLCDKVCPIRHPLPKNGALEAYAAVNKDASTLQKSSSGGVFSALAECVISYGGGVFGAVLRDNRVFHCYANKVEELIEMRGSKYVQSDVEHAMLTAKQLIDSGNLVLFTGTPCQCAAIRKVIGDNQFLITMDFVCHGVPSPAVFEDYISYLESKEKGHVIFKGFRDKQKDRIGVYETYTVDESNKGNAVFDSRYLTGFMRGYLNRPSCYSCPYATRERSSDITVCDYWECEKYHPEYDPIRGISAVIVNTEHGKRWFNEASRKLEVTPTNVSNIAAGNANLSSATPRPSERDEFYSKRESNSFDELAKQYFTDSLAWEKRLIARIPKGLKKMLKGTKRK